MLEQTLRSSLTSLWFLAIWSLATAISLAVLWRDLMRNNAHLVSLMKWVWTFTVAYSGPLGLAVYYCSGDPLFWSSLVFSLSVGLIAAYPVNVLLIRLGVKKGMHSPKHMAHGD